MTIFTKQNLFVAASAFALALTTAPTSAFAQSYGSPVPPTLEFPVDGAFADKAKGCFLFFCASEPEVAQDITSPGTVGGE